MCIHVIRRSCCLDEALPVLPETGLSNRIRGLFEGAASTEMGAHCPLLWRMYIHFLVRRLTTHPKTQLIPIKKG